MLESESYLKVVLYNSAERGTLLPKTWWLKLFISSGFTTTYKPEYLRGERGYRLNENRFSSPT